MREKNNIEFYIFAPAGVTSGGPELAHQLCHTINSLTKYDAYMCYVDTSNRYHENSFPVDIDSPAAYQEYETTHALSKEEIDKEENVVVVPEGLTYSFRGISKAKKVLWWMSVDNYLVSTRGENLQELRDTVQLHLLQSYYAKKYVEQEFFSAKALFLTDYINLLHGQFMLPGMYRRDVVLYNPKKGREYIEVMQKEIPEVQWKAISNMNLEQVIVAMQSSKAYVDFGNHPGKDRIPREAAANGCCIITNKQGSAAFTEDVPIPEQYKFTAPLAEVERLRELLLDICGNYSEHFSDFEEYRNWIKGEKVRFDEEVLEFVRSIS